MIEQEKHFQFKAFKLSDKEMKEFEKKAIEIDKEAKEARKILEKALPLASEKTLDIRIK